MAVYSEDIIAKTIDFVKSKSEVESSGHDWWHIYRVHKMALYLAKKEKADLFIVELSALLHDMDDWKFNKPDSCHANDWLNLCKIDPSIKEQVVSTISCVSFLGAGEPNSAVTKEAQVVQDADRLDAIGAIGIARAFAYGGHKNRKMYQPGVAPLLHKNFNEYQKSQSNTINHFFEKLLLLKEKMNTSTAKELAEKRHKILENFLTEFFAEWNFNDLSANQK